MRHLHKIDSVPYTYSDRGQVDLTGHPKLDDGWEIVEGDIPEGSVRLNKTPLTDRLRAKIDQLPDAALAQYAPLIASVEPLIKAGRVGAVKAMIQGARLVSDSHKPLRDALLDEPEFGE